MPIGDPPIVSCNFNHPRNWPCTICTPPEPIEEFDALHVEVMPGVVIRPGDTLVLSSGPLTRQHATELRERVKQALPGLVDVLLLNGAHVEGVYRDEPTACLPPKGEPTR